PEHPYHHTTIGEHEDLAHASVEDVRGFFRKYYAPSNATVAIVGDIDRAATKALCEKYFGTLPAVPAPDHPRASAPLAPVVSKVQMEANVQLPRVDYVWHAPTPFSTDEPALDLLAMVLAEGKSTRLHKRLVYELRIAQSVNVGLDALEYGGSYEV